MNRLKVFLPFILAGIIGITTGLLTNEAYGVISFFAVVLLFIAYVWLRQLYWFVTKKEYYKLKELVFKKGEHYPKYKLSYFGLFILSIKPKFFWWTVEFTESCRYKFNDEDQHDVNKLMGFSLGWHHHKNSVRVGWRYNNIEDKIELIAYRYKNGERLPSKLIKKVDIGESVVVSFLFVKSNLELSINNTSRNIQVSNKPLLGYRIIPYFGGNKTAPHDIQVKMRRYK